MYRIELSKQAQKFLAREVPKKYYQIIRDHIDELQHDPHPHGSIKLKDSDDLYRIRVGPYRIIYSVFHKELIVHVITIGDRKDVYN